jgi:hypothetical protein
MMVARMVVTSVQLQAANWDEYLDNKKVVRSEQE